jgi:L-threonylcarbamoyladenylate synthase
MTRAIALLRAGDVVAFPTETVYGLGADASNDAALAKVFALKGRPTDHPLIVHLASATQFTAWAADPLPQSVVALAAAFCPGPITFLVQKAERVSYAVTGGRNSVGLRVPSDPIAQQLLAGFGGGIAAPSANRFGRVSPTTAEHVRAEFGDRLAMVLDGGSSTIGIESTIVDCTTTPVTVLRWGAITREMLTVVLDEAPLEPSGPSRAPGMLDSHYAPRCAVVLTDTRAEADHLQLRLTASGQIEILDPGDDLAYYAHGLYRWLREADQRGVDTLIVVRPAGHGLGAAINERLSKAAAPRPLN